MIKTFFVPVIVFLLITPLAYIVIGPVSAIICKILGIIFGTIFGLLVVGGLVGGLLIAAFWQVFVIFGLHWGLIPLAMINYGTLGFDYILAASFPASFAQTAVVFAIYLKTKNKTTKEIALPAVLSGICGVTEPCIYGITLPKKKPFIISCVAAAIGGAVMGFAGVNTYTLGGLGIFGFPNFIDNSFGTGIRSLIWAVIGTVIAMVVAFIATWIIYIEDEGGC